MTAAFYRLLKLAVPTIVCSIRGCTRSPHCNQTHVETEYDFETEYGVETEYNRGNTHGKQGGRYGGVGAPEASLWRQSASLRLTADAWTI